MGLSPNPPVLKAGQPSKALAEWTREEIAARILAGEALFIYRSRVVRVTPSWLKRHPGGELAILHFVGRDATDEVDAFHVDDVLRTMQHYIVARVRDGLNGWEPLVPPYMNGWLWRDGQWVRQADPIHNTPAGVRAEAAGYNHDEISPSSQILLVEKGTIGQQVKIDRPSLETISPPPSTLSRKVQAQHSVAYKELHQRVINAGLYKTRFVTGIGPDILRYILFAGLAAWFYQKHWFFLSAVFLGIFWHQLTFFAHDLGHMGVTHNWTLDRLISIFIADFCGGLSIGWWVNNHNVHHLVTNHPTHDPDIEHLPFFAISPHFLSSLYSSYYKRVLPFDFACKLFIRIQHKLFYVVMSLARFNLYRLSCSYLFNARHANVKARGGRWSWWCEIVGILVFWAWYGAVLRGTGSWQNVLKYMLVSHVMTSPLHVQIVLSHFSRSSADLGPVESFAARQLRTTVDVICPEYMAFVHGGLHLQVTHHLFPRLPRHNLKAASKLVKEFAKEQGLEYAEFGFIEGNKEVRGVLRNVAQQVKVMNTVLDANIKEALNVASQ
ncbi:delta 8-sphingoloid desaturase protein [Fomitiporia mediterranea MF3/22]|uniref:delta 8-sphingoloid desaturase protein n=1 Tax=Fomitiporia mediterranea (strain MF3/22) TaxID=694068 RepID=UPI0004407B76|nr:delta 8-sphingoloid desaturase protein [Fomitiporia mediterranea MF3/22]EJD04084.1 delta 8-sphingoloid desaturase protein [Fomitiporia mediterranea MF3/22]